MDLKEMFCERADELALELYNQEFYDLSRDIQDKVWLMAEKSVIEGCYDQADYLKKEGVR